MNKTIYMTYKKNVPQFVFDRWKSLNKDYKIDFSLDDNCVEFLELHFNKYISDLFIKIPEGMYKADLWRLCKLYIHGGVYADVDLVPYIDLETLPSDITFYSCKGFNLSAIFQAFMMVKEPRNPLILNFIISFLMNNLYLKVLGPVFDMYDCIKYNLNVGSISTETKYTLNEIKIPIKIGPSESNIKEIDLHFFPNEVTYEIKLVENIYKDIFDFSIKDNKLIIKRVDETIGWGYDHSVNIILHSNESIFLFPEQYKNDSHFVSLNNKKILDSRDPIYAKNKSW